MKRLKTLRFRFALWTAGLLLAALTIFGLFVYINLARNLTATVDETLHSSATQLIAEGMRGGLLILDDLVDDPQWMRLNEQGLSVRVLSLTGHTLQRHGPYQTLPQPQTTANHSFLPDDLSTVIDPASQESVRVYTTAMVKDEQVLGILQVALTLRNVQQTMNFLLTALLIGVPLMVLLAGSGGYFLAAQALTPIDHVTRTAQQISGSDLSARLNLPKTDDEVGRLVRTFDSMLERLENAFRRERQFTGDASHELRTPLTAMQTIISSTLARQRTPSEYAEALNDLNAETEHMRSLTEGLLILARNDTPHQPLKFEHVDLSLLLKDVIDSLRPLAEGKGLQLIDAIPATKLVVMGDSDALIRLFVNLVDNAIKYTNHGTITLAAQNDDTQSNDGQSNNPGVTKITVSDTGVGIADQHLPRVFDRFYQADQSRGKGGIGLGLAIAQTIVQAHAGTIMVTSEVGKGTTFEVRL